MNFSNYTGDLDMNAKLALSLEEVLNMLLMILVIAAFIVFDGKGAKKDGIALMQCIWNYR